MHRDVHFALTQTSPPASEPLTLAETKTWLRIDSGDTSQDGLIPYLISGARERFEELTGRALITQSWLLTLDRFSYAGAAYWLYGDASWGEGGGRGGGSWGAGFAGDHVHGLDGPGYRAIRLPRPPLQSITSIQYVDGGGTLQTLSSTLYQVDTVSEPGRVIPAYGQIWPVVRYQLGSVQISYVAGIASSAATLPARYKERMLAHVAYTFREREAPDQTFLDSLYWPFFSGETL